MPIRIPDQLPASDVLRKENIFVMPESRASTQEIRPLKILILNLMPKKIETETQFLRLLSNSPLQLDIELLRIDDRPSKNTPEEHLNAFYRQFDKIKARNFDGLIITGAPLGLVQFEDVAYWDHLQTIMTWAKSHVTSTLYVCWAAQAGLKLLYNLPREHVRKNSLEFTITTSISHSTQSCVVLMIPFWLLILVMQILKPTF